MLPQNVVWEDLGKLFFVRGEHQNVPEGQTVPEVLIVCLLRFEFHFRWVYSMLFLISVHFAGRHITHDRARGLTVLS